MGSNWTNGSSEGYKGDILILKVVGKGYLWEFSENWNEDCDHVTKCG